MQQLSLQLAPPPAPTFDNFFPARNAAVVAQLRAAAAGEERFLYLWGPRGSGKSHLLQAFISAAAGAGRRAACYAAGQPLDADCTVLACDDVHALDLVGQLA